MDTKQTLEYIIKSILPKDTQFSVEFSDGGFQEVYTITIDPSLAGQIIGKEGRIIKAIRQVMGGASKPFSIQIKN